MAMAKLGRAEESQAAFRRLVESGESGIQAAASGEGSDGAAAAHLSAAFGHLGLNETILASREFGAALQAEPDLLAARLELAEPR
jgi:hypothetical protein